MKKKILLGFTSAAIGLSFLGCAGGNSNLQPKTYTAKNITYKDYKFIKVDPVDNDKITTEEVKNYVKTHAYKFGRILKTTKAVYMHNSTTIRENITADDNYIKGIATIKDNMPFSKDECKITFTKPYKVIKTDNHIVLKVAKKANNITFSKDCYAKTTFGNKYLYMPYQNEFIVKYNINKLPETLYLANKQISTAGKFISSNPANVIYANLSRHFKKYNVSRYGYSPDEFSLTTGNYYRVTRKFKKTDKVKNLFNNYNLSVKNFINHFYYKKTDDKLYVVGVYTDPAKNGTKVYYVAYEFYPIKSDGKIHATKKEFNNFIKDFKKIINQ